MPAVSAASPSNETVYSQPTLYPMRSIKQSAKPANQVSSARRLLRVILREIPDHDVGI